MNKLTSISLHYHWVMGSSYYILYNILLILYKSGEVVTFFEEDGRRGMTEAVSYANKFLHCCFFAVTVMSAKLVRRLTNHHIV